MGTLFRVLKYVATAVAGLELIVIIVSLSTTIKKAIRLKYASILEGIKDFFSGISNLASEFTQEKKITVFVSILAMCFALAVSPVVHKAIGLHNLLLEDEGVHCYYIKITDYKNTYTLPAGIRIEKEETTNFYLEKVYFSNGECLDFSDNDSIYIDDPSYMYDQNDKEWEVRLINEHAYSQYIQETDESVVYIVFLVVELFVLMLTILSCIFA